MAPDLEVIVGYADDYMLWGNSETNMSARDFWFDKACVMFDQALKFVSAPDVDRSKIVKVMYERAAISIERGEYEKAKEDLRQAVHLDQWNPIVRAELGLVHVQLGNLKKGKKNLEMVTRLDGWGKMPDEKKAMVYINLAQLAAVDEDDDLALDLVDKSDMFKTDNPVIIASRAHVLNQLYMHEEAKQEFEKISPVGFGEGIPTADIAAIYHTRSVTNLHLVGVKEALKDLETAIVYDSQNQAIRADHGMLLVSMEEYEDAETELNVAISMDDGSDYESLAELYNALSIALDGQKEYEKARDALVKAKDLGIDLEGLYFNLGELELKLGDAKEASKYFAYHLGFDPEGEKTDKQKAELLVVVSRAYNELGDNQNALLSLDRAHELDKENVTILLERGMIHSTEGSKKAEASRNEESKKAKESYKKAEADLVAAIKQNKEGTYQVMGEAYFHFELGVAKALNEKGDEGEQEVLYALSIKGDAGLSDEILPRVYAELGFIRLNNGNIIEARQSFETSIGMNPQVNTFYGLGNTYLADGDEIGAEMAYQDGLKFFDGIEEKDKKDWIDAIELEILYNQVSLREESPILTKALTEGIVTEEDMGIESYANPKMLH